MVGFCYTVRYMELIFNEISLSIIAGCPTRYRVRHLFNNSISPVWTQMVATSSTCHDVTFLTQRTYSCSNFVAVSSFVLELLKKCRVL